MQSSFFDVPDFLTADSDHQILELENGRLDLYQALFPSQQADELFAELQEAIAWRQETIRIQGRVLDIPRLQAWYGDPDSHYGYSGIRLDPLPWIPPLLTILHRLEDMTQHRFNSVLCNLYRHGRDSVSWHADNEAELGINPLIASVSFGATRRFQLKPRKGGDSISLELPHNSLLVMSGALQHHWIHQIPKTQQPVGPRLNLTFRWVSRAAQADR